MLVLGACAPVGPDHEVPSMELPSSFSQGGVTWKRRSPDTLPEPRAWWKLFRDPTLDSLVERALVMNQEIAASAARLRQAREISNSARSLYFPAVDIGAAAERSKFRFRGPGGGSSTMDSFTVPLDFRYEIERMNPGPEYYDRAISSLAALRMVSTSSALSL